MSNYASLAVNRLLNPDFVMKKPADVHPSTNINAQLLKSDRKIAGFTQASFAAACDSVSLATIRRAEQGHRIITASLRRMTAVLEQDVQRYIANDSPEKDSEYAAWIEGEWLGFYVEADHRFLPYVITADISIKQIGTQIEGRWVCATPIGERVEKYLDCKIRNNNLTGFTRVEGLALPRGVASLNQVSSRNNAWLEGYSIWFDSRTGSSEVSRNIAVRKDSQFFYRYLDEARFIITKELTNYRMRKLIEAGYPIGDAVKMLDSIETYDDVGDESADRDS